MSIFNSRRLTNATFKLDVERMRRGWYSDKYFENVGNMLHTLAKQGYTFQAASPRVPDGSLRGGWARCIRDRPRTGGTVQKSDREIMEILEAFDLTRCAHSAAELAGCDPKTVARYVGARAIGADPHARVRRPMLLDRYRDKIEELVERSGGRVRADVVHERLCALDPGQPYAASERTARRSKPWESR
jgi:hypothetical protein